MSDLPIEVIRSERRRRTAQAYMVDGKLRIMIPAGLEPDVESKLIDDMATRARRRMEATQVDLTVRARDLARMYQLQEPTSIEWSDRQMKRWGSCTHSTGRIRISTRLTSVPRWVLDWVIIHELSHLEEPNHGPRFKALVGRYELAERAMGYLTAISDQRREASSVSAARPGGPAPF